MIDRHIMQGAMNRIGHFDIPTMDFKNAKKFYGTVFDWQFDDIPGKWTASFDSPDGCRIFLWQTARQE